MMDLIAIFFLVYAFIQVVRGKDEDAQFAFAMFSLYAIGGTILTKLDELINKR